MEAVSYSTFRGNLRSYLDKTRDDAEPLLVTSTCPDSNVVVMNARDYEVLMENFSVQSNSYLLAKIQRGRAQAQAGTVRAHELIEDEPL